MINHIISECNKLAVKVYKTWHDWIGKIIYWELYKRVKFDHTNKWHMHNPESVLEYETHKLFWDFEIQTDHQISARQTNLVIVNSKKRTYRIVNFTVQVNNRTKSIKSRKINKYVDLARGLKKTMKHEDDGFMFHVSLKKRNTIE